jgi:glycosyltransferase involved in cell wall biosynthesis
MSAPVVWVVSPFSDPSPEAEFDRYRFICAELTRRGAKVCQFVSSFDHGQKRHRRPPQAPWRVVAVPEPGYARNVSVRRLASHVVFDALVILYFLREMIRGGRPEVILSAVPHNGAACVAGALARISGARFIVDVHDTWPESLLGVTRLRGPMRVGYRIWKAVADAALVAADQVFAESSRYAARADEVRIPRGKSKARAILLGGDLAYYDAIAPAERLPDGLDGARFVVAYAGTLGANYDLDCVLEAFTLLAAEQPDSALLLLGRGEREEDLRAAIARAGLPAWVSGQIPHASLVAHLKRSRVGLNAFKAGGNVAYSYKLNDYLLSGVPVVNSLPGESADLLEGNGLGFNYRAGDPADLLAALRAARLRWEADPKWGSEVLAFSGRHLDRRTSYEELLRCCLPGPSRS